MDWLRSGYTVPMLFNVDGDPQNVQWYKCDPEALAFPGYHAFPSANWSNRDSDLGELGEQPGGRPWVRHSPGPAARGNGSVSGASCVVMHPTWWTDGLPVGDTMGPRNANGLPDCCIGSCIDTDFDILSAEIIDLNGCSNLGQPSALERIDPSVCKWLATFDITGMTTAAAAVEYIGADSWELTTTCQSSVITATAPFVAGQVVDFDVTDDFPCCDQGSPPRSFRLRVTIPL